MLFQDVPEFYTFFEMSTHFSANQAVVNEESNRLVAWKHLV